MNYKSLKKTIVAFGLIGAVAAPALASDSDSEEEVESAVDSVLSGLSAEGYAPEVSQAARVRAGGIVDAARGFRPVRFDTVPEDWVEAGLDLSRATREGDRLVQVLPSGAKVTFTVDPDVQVYLEKMLADYNVPHSGIVLLEPESGRVQAMVSHTQASPPIDALAVKATAPSASVFKIVTAAALMETAGISPEGKTCYHGGRSRLTKRNIKGDPNRDHKCNDLGAALAWSINSIVAKLTYNHLSREDLEVWSEKFAYNTEIPFEFPVEVSTAQMVDDPYERARAAAGFWHTHLSPLHGAMIGAAVANGGVMMAPSIVESFEDSEGEVLHEFEPRVFKRVMATETADTLAELMVQTTEKGTARRYFKWRGSFPNHIVASGKTGTLSNKDPYLGFTWFVGFAENPRLDGKRVAVSSLLCNTPKWRIKGPYAASEAVRSYFQHAKARHDRLVARQESSASSSL